MQSQVFLLALALLSTATAGCYRPQLDECAVRCGGAEDCAPGQVCGSDGWCAASANAGQCARAGGSVPVTDASATLDVATPAIDASPMLDGAVPMPDASLPPLPDAGGDGCGAGCPGSCQGTVCVIECSGGDCSGPIVCPATGACLVRCMGNGSCVDQIQCGSGRCEVECSGNASCAGGVQCQNACSCDVTCGGNGACGPMMCPGSACQVGEGCMSSGPSCSSC
ncbi:MAG: hypothetical protein H0T42_06010 [Deltaproteobacteria bacterium]|nr:hypothetical protein [Deltaproteobacteria bacterium]